MPPFRPLFILFENDETAKLGYETNSYCRQCHLLFHSSLFVHWSCQTDGDATFQGTVNVFAANRLHGRYVFLGPPDR